jgi:hypothetical protein
MTIQRELLDPHGPFETLQALQAALEAWRGEYNGNRPHQSLAMAFPAARFIPAQSPLGLQIPGQLIASASSPACAPADPPTPEPAPASPPPGPDPASQAGAAIEADRVVPPSGNLWIGGQQIWLGAALAGRKITIWADERTVHVLLDRTRIKTLPSRLGITELARLAASGARLAGPSPLPAGGGTAIEVDRLVNATGLASLAGRRFSVGYELAGQQITLRMDSTQMAILGHAGTLLRTMPCPVPPAARPRLRGARRASPIVPRPAGPVTVQRRVSSRGSIMVATQKIQAGPFIAVWRSVRAGGDTKTKKSRRTLALPQRCVDVLREHQMRQDQIRQAASTRWKENGLVFPSRVGTPLMLRTSGAHSGRWSRWPG